MFSKSFSSSVSDPGSISCPKTSFRVRSLEDRCSLNYPAAAVGAAWFQRLQRCHRPADLWALRAPPSARLHLYGEATQLNHPPCSETYSFQWRYISYSYGGVQAVGAATIGFSHDGENSSNRIVPESPLNHLVIVLTERVKNWLFDLSLFRFCQTVALRFLRTNFWRVVTSHC